MQIQLHWSLLLYLLVKAWLFYYIFLVGKCFYRIHDQKKIVGILFDYFFYSYFRLKLLRKLNLLLKHFQHHLILAHLDLKVLNELLLLFEIFDCFLDLSYYLHYYLYHLYNYYFLELALLKKYFLYSLDLFLYCYMNNVILNIFNITIVFLFFVGHFN